MHVRAYGVIGADIAAAQLAYAFVYVRTIVGGHVLPCADRERAILDDHLHVQRRTFSVEIIDTFGDALGVGAFLMVFRCVIEDFALGFRT